MTINFGLLQQAQAPQTQMVSAPAGPSVAGLLSQLQGAFKQAAPTAPGQPYSAPTSGPGSPMLPNPLNPGGLNTVQQGIQQAMPTQDLSIDNIKKDAADVWGDNSKMANISTSQAILESRLNGTPSQLASKYNNLYGIKGVGTQGSVTLPTQEYINGQMVTVPQPFAVFGSPKESMEAHKRLLENPRYKGVNDATDFASAASALHQAGYATDPNYAKSLIAINNQYNGTPDDNS